MILTVLGCCGSEAPGGRTCSFRLGDHAVLEMGSAAGTLSLEDQAGIREVFLSHAHLDHTKDLAFFAENVLALNGVPVNVRGTPNTLAKIERHLLNNQIWPDFTQLPTPEQPVLRYAPFEPETEVVVDGLKMWSVPVNHPGSCVALFFASDTGTLVYSGDTGPTEALWQAVNRRGKDVRAILLETSFPDRLADLAEISGHLTPRTLSRELEKLDAPDVPIYLHHMKAPTRDETLAEIAALGDARLRILAPGMTIEF